jgi:hypothetical protein
MFVVISLNAKEKAKLYLVVVEPKAKKQEALNGLNKDYYYTRKTIAFHLCYCL